MTYRVVYPQDNGVPAIVHILDGSAPELHVPAGVPYLVVPTEDVPQDRSERSAWELDFSVPTGIGVRT